MADEEYPLHKLSNGALLEYLDLMSSTESPPIFHAWSLISAVSACLGRRCWFQMGAIRIMPNQYVMLVGAPGVRKSSCISFARGLLEDVQGLRFAPNNTAGRMQGLMSAMVGPKPRKTEDDDIDDTLGNLTLNLVDGLDISGGDEDEGNMLDRHALYVMEGELASFIGIKSTDFITFLTDMWDKSGETKYSYQLKSEATTVNFPCLNIIGAITQMHLTTYLPAEAIGQGFMSRVVMVYAESTKKIAWPEPIDPKLKNGYKALLTNVFTQREGVFDYTPEAKECIINLHNKGYGQIEDARFLHYMQRRQTHMIKCAMAFAAMRMDQTVTEGDVLDAHQLLTMTESKMAESLGDYGLSPIALARSRVMDILREAKEPLTAPRIAMAVGGDIRHPDLQKAMYELEESGQLISIVAEDATGQRRTAYITHKTLVVRNSEGNVKVNYPVTASAVSVRTAGAAPPVTPDRIIQKPAQDLTQMGEEYKPPADAPVDHKGKLTLAQTGGSILDLMQQHSNAK